MQINYIPYSVTIFSSNFHHSFIRLACYLAFLYFFEKERHFSFKMTLPQNSANRVSEDLKVKHFPDRTGVWAAPSVEPNLLKTRIRDSALRRSAAASQLLALDLD